jgi:uncharacterized lipoprotein YddW (UPF0748 family)
MNRRKFLQTGVCAGAAMAGGQLSRVLAAETAALGISEQQRSQSPSTSRLKNWVWVPIDAYKSRDEWKRGLDQMREAGIHAILPEIYDSHNAYYASHHLPVKQDVLGPLLPLAKAAGIEVHAWMWSMPCNLPDMLQKHPDWYNVNARGESAATKPAYVDYYKFLDPGRPEVRAWVQQTVDELASIPDLAGVHLDYIRHPDSILPSGLWSKYKIVQDKVYPQYDYGYSEYERTRYKQAHGIDAMQIADPSHNQQWVRFRLDMVVDLVNDFLVPAAKKHNKMITAAVFPGPSLARMMVRQDWARFHVDAFLPMLYNVFYQAGPEWVGKQTEEAIYTVKQPIYSGLFVHDVDVPTFERMVDAALDSGAAGVSLFSAGGMNDQKWKALRDIMTARKLA